MDDNITRCVDFLKTNNINPFKIKEWEEMLNKECIDPEEYDVLILYFAMSIDGGLAHYSYKSESPEFLAEIKDTIYQNLKNERSRGKIDMITEFGALVVGKLSEKILNDNTMLISVFTSFILLGIVNIGIDAWCDYYEKSKKSQGEDDG